jgi:CheY-like chemotaxis protein
MSEIANDSHPTRLLIVDDSRLIVQMVRDFFAGEGYAVDVAADGAVALARIDANPPDVIVADILMPQVDGWELYEEVRKRPATAETPFIFLTTETELPERLRGFRIGADDYVTKPFEVEELHARVERSLYRRQSRGTETVDADVYLSGSVEHLAMPDLLQILAMNGKTGIMKLRRGERTGAIRFVDGEIYHAAAGRVRGVKALYRMLAWDDAEFRFEGAARDTVERSVEGATSNVLMDGLVALDEWRRWKGRLPAPDTRLAVRDNARERLRAETVTPAVFDVIARVANGATVEEILDDSPVPDGELASAICTLIEHGIVYPC